MVVTGQSLQMRWLASLTNWPLLNPQATQAPKQVPPVPQAFSSILKALGLLLSVGQGLSRGGVYYFSQEMVFPDMHSTLVLALAAYPGPDNLGQAVEVNGGYANLGFDFGSHLFCPRFGTTGSNS